MAGLCIALSILSLPGCTTSYVEFEGECLQQRWGFIGYTVRERNLCDFPKPKLVGPDERVLREKEPMNPNPYPNLFEGNRADSLDPDLLEKRRKEIESNE